MKKTNFLHPEDFGMDPDPLSLITDPRIRIRIRTQMSGMRNTGSKDYVHYIGFCLSLTMKRTVPIPGFNEIIF